MKFTLPFIVLVLVAGVAPLDAQKLWKPVLRDLTIEPSTIDNTPTLDVSFLLDLPEATNPVTAGSNLVIRPSAGSVQFTESSVPFVGHAKTYRFRMNLRDRGRPLSVEEIATLGAVDLTVRLEASPPGPADANALSTTFLDFMRPTSVGPRLRLTLRAQTQGTVTIVNGGVYNLGTWSSGQLFEGNYFEVFNDGDAPLTLIPQKNGKFLSVVGDGLLRAYNVGDSGKQPIPPMHESSVRNGTSLGLSLGDFKSKPGTSHTALVTLSTNDPLAPTLKFTLTFDLQSPGPNLRVLYSRDHFDSALVPTWSMVTGATGYQLVRAPWGSTEPYSVIYEGPELSFEDLGLTRFGPYPEVHYFVRALLANGKAAAWSWEGWSRLVDPRNFDPYDYSGTYHFDGEPEGAVRLSLGEKQEHNFFPMEDNDWLWFEAKKGVVYELRVVPRDQDMTLKFHLDMGTTPSSLNGPYHEATSSKPVVLTWKAPVTGKAFVRLRGRADMSSINPWYSVVLTEKR